MRNTRKFTYYVNLGALAALIAAVVALLCTEKLPKIAANRAPASAVAPSVPH